MPKRLLTAAFIVLLCSLACEGDTFRPVNEFVVLQGYVYAGERVRDIRVTSTLGLGSLDSIGKPIDDAEVQLIKGGVCYYLQSAGYFKRPGFYEYDTQCPEGDCPDAALKIEPGDSLRLEVMYFDKVAIAETVVPQIPTGLGLQPQTLSVPQGSTGAAEFPDGGLFRNDTTVAVTVTWDDDGRSWYYVSMETMEYVGAIDPANPVYHPKRFVSQPITGGRFKIGKINITHYGRHKITVYRVTPEYAEFYLTRNQNTRDLNEPSSNVSNGLGIFTAFSPSIIYLQVEKP